MHGYIVLVLKTYYQQSWCSLLLSLCRRHTHAMDLVLAHTHNSIKYGFRPATDYGANGASRMRILNVEELLEHIKSQPISKFLPSKRFISQFPMNSWSPKMEITYPASGWGEGTHGGSGLKLVL